MNQELADELASLVAAGKGLRECIKAAGLPLRETLTGLRDGHRQQFRDAKRAQIEARLRVPQREAKALEILRTPIETEPVAEEPRSGR
jgi:hypothetical protein